MKDMRIIKNNLTIKAGITEVDAGGREYFLRAAHNNKVMVVPLTTTNRLDKKLYCGTI